MPQETVSTQSFVEIKEIRDGVVYLKNGGLRKILIVSGINFDLKSQEEQELILGAFQDFLNTIDYPVQFFIHSRKVNINSYLEKVKQREKQETNELLKIQINDYIDFIGSFVKENPIITKTFFVVVPYSPTISISQAKKGLFGFALGGGGSISKKETLEKSIQQLNYRVNQVIDGLEQIGLRVNSLKDEELIELFYNLYNPEIIEKKGKEIPQILPKK